MGQEHVHEHAHEHAHRVESGAVLDIGGDVGALVVTTGADLVGAEVELYDGDGRYVTHTDVHSRTVAGTTVHAGLFPALPAAEYALQPRPGGPRTRVRIRGGEVTTVRVTG